MNTTQQNRLRRQLAMAFTPAVADDVVTMVMADGGTLSADIKMQIRLRMRGQYGEDFIDAVEGGTALPERTLQRVARKICSYPLTLALQDQLSS